MQQIHEITKNFQITKSGDNSTLKMSNAPLPKEGNPQLLALYFRNPIKDETIEQFVKIMSVNFNVNYADLKSNDGLKMEMLITQCKADNITDDEFLVLARRFVKKHKYVNWTLSDFFEMERPKLYHYNDVINELDYYDPVKIKGQVFWVKKEERPEYMEVYAADTTRIEPIKREIENIDFTNGKKELELTIENNNLRKEVQHLIIERAVLIERIAALTQDNEKLINQLKGE